MKFKTENKPTSAQIAALRFYAQTHGRTWKSQLRECWMTGIYEDRDNSRELQLVRNNLGPSWLISFKLPALVCYKCGLPITDSCYMGNEDGTFNHLNACPQPKKTGRSRKRKWDLYCSPEGRKIATVDAVTGPEAIRKAPMPYRKYLGEIYANEVVPTQMTVQTCIKCGKQANVSSDCEQWACPTCTRVQKTII